MRRVLAVVTTLAVVGALATGCQGSPAGHTVDVAMHCTGTAGAGIAPTWDFGTETAHVSFVAPNWTNPGETVQLSNLTIQGLSWPTGFDGTSTPVPVGNPVGGSLTIGGASYFVSSTAGTGGSVNPDFGSVSVPVSRSATGQISIALSSVSTGGIGWSGTGAETESRLCVPVDGVGQIGVINIEGPAVPTTTSAVAN